MRLYAGFLQQSSDVKNLDLREIERDLDPKVIILWRYSIMCSLIFNTHEMDRSMSRVAESFCSHLNI